VIFFDGVLLNTDWLAELCFGLLSTTLLACFDVCFDGFAGAGDAIFAVAVVVAVVVAAALPRLRSPHQMPRHKTTATDRSYSGSCRNRRCRRSR